MGTGDKPRVSVFRSNKYLYAQLIDDASGRTLISVSSRSLGKAGNKTEQSKKLGEMLGEKTKALGIQRAVFNKGSYKFHGRVKALVDGVRTQGVNI